MKRTYRWDRATRKLVEITARKRIITHEVMPDIAPYKSMMTGEMITGRRQHRDHLRDHGCIEVGNEKGEAKATFVHRDSIRNDIREAKRQLEWGEAPTLERLREETPRIRRELGLDE